MSAPFDKFNLDKQTMAFLVAIGLLAAGGIWLLLYSTPEGLGLNDDAIAYVAGARSIMNGNGYREAWLASNGPVTHFPPGFPVVLAVIGIVTGLDPLRGARALNGLLFGFSIALTGWLGWRMTRSRIAGILVAALALLNSSFLYIHTRAMSEPLNIFLMLISFLLLDYYFEHSKTYLLVSLGFVLGWAYLTRYAALALFAMMVVVLLVLPRSWQERLKSVSIMAISALPWMIGWSVRNRVVGGSFTNRVLGWHPVNLENWELGVKTFAEFLAPLQSFRKAINQIPASFEIILVLIGLAILTWVIYKGFPPFFRPAQAARPDVLQFANALYIIAYLSVLILTMSLFDPATKFQVRILSPTYLSLLLLLMALGVWLWQKNNAVLKPIVFVCALGILGMFAYGQLESVQNLRKGGDGFASEKWYASEAFTALDQIPPGVLILSNEPGVVYLYTGRPSGVLPDEEPGISTIKQAVLDGKIAIVLFHVNKTDDSTLDYYYELGSGLYQKDLSNTWLFTAFPK
jgi:4-amino-4-deoxy-L-arabinose transferase-like glycosyltransferase